MSLDRDTLDQRLGDDDPLAIFRQMPTPVVDEVGIANMKSRVADLRRARALSQDPQYAWAFSEPKARPSWIGWRGAAVLGLLLLPAALLQGPGPQGGWSTPGLAVVVQPDAALSAVNTASALNAAAAALPLVEDFDLAAGEVLQFEGEDLSVVIVH